MKIEHKYFHIHNLKLNQLTVSTLEQFIDNSSLQMNTIEDLINKEIHLNKSLYSEALKFTVESYILPYTIECSGNVWWGTNMTPRID